MKKSKQQYRKECRDFLKENRRREDVVTLPSGVQYRVITAGEGEKPKSNSLVHAYYKGRLVDGRSFDDNTGEALPSLFRVFEVIDGWQEVLPLMPEGSIYEVVIPYELGYGKKADGNIPGYSTLIFEIQLIKVE
jgi:FKBP-type peptidyl-prolyl cis-trans isomerase